MNIKVVSTKELQYLNQCLNIAKQYKRMDKINRLHHANYLVCAQKEGKVVGFIAMLDNKILSGDFYVTQVGVDKDYRGQGVAEMLLDYVKHHSKGFRRITSDINSTNSASKSLHEKAGFIMVNEHSTIQRYIILVNTIQENEYIQYSDDSTENFCF